MGGEITRVMVFPYDYAGYVSWTEDGTVSVNGAVVNQKAKTTDSDGTLLPIRAVAEALGYTVRWDAARGAVITQGELTVFTAMPGGAINGVDADGQTYEVYGTCLKEAGVTYLSSAALLNLLDLYHAA